MFCNHILCNKKINIFHAECRHTVKSLNNCKGTLKQHYLVFSIVQLIWLNPESSIIRKTGSCPFKSFYLIDL